MILSCYVDDETYARLFLAHRRTGRSIVDLAESAIAEAALLETRDHEAHRGPADCSRVAPGSAPG
jgi:hypothetical protein